MHMNKPQLYEIRVAGHLSDGWSDWFEGMDIQNHANGETSLSGPLDDQAALLGALTRIHSLNLTLLSVQRRTSSTGTAEKTLA